MEVRFLMDFRRGLTCLCLLSASFTSVTVLLGDDEDDRRRRLSSPSSTVNPQHEAAKRRAEQAYTSGDFAKVVPLMDGVLRSNPRDDVALYLRGSAKIELGIAAGDAAKVRDGISDSRNAILHDTKGQMMYYLPYLYGMTNLTALEKKPNHANTAVSVATQALSKPGLKDEDRANLLYQRALAEQTNEKYDAAAKDYRQAVSVQPSHLGARVALAETLVAAGKDADALKAFADAIDAFPNNPLVYNNRGMYYQQKGKYDESIVDFTRAIEEDPNFVYAYTNRGYSLEKMGNLPAAEVEYSQSLKKDDRQPAVHRLRAECRLAQGKPREAMADYRRMVELNPRNHTARAEFGFAQYFAGDPAGAYATLSQAASLDRELRYVDPWRYLTAVKSGKTAQADALLRTSLNKAVSQRDWIDLLILYQAGKISLEDLRKGYSDEPEMKAMQVVESDFFAGEKDLDAGDQAAAEAHFRDALSKGLRHLSAYRGAQYALKQFNTAAAEPAAKN